MSSHKVQTVEQGAILVASDLLTGRLVYRSRDRAWSGRLKDALVFTSMEQAGPQLTDALRETTVVVDPYLVATDQAGQPEHIREAIRAHGPTFRNGAVFQAQGHAFVQPD